MAVAVTGPAPAREPWPATVRAARIRLGAVRESDPAPAWLATAEAAISGDGSRCTLAGRLAAGDAAYWIRAVGKADRGAVGALAVCERNGALQWTWLAVDATWRAYGYGGAAVPVVERTAKRRGLRRAQVRTPAANGVALYFWVAVGLPGADGRGSAWSGVRRLDAARAVVSGRRVSRRVSG